MSIGTSCNSYYNLYNNYSNIESVFSDETAVVSNTNIFRPHPLSNAELLNIQSTAHSFMIHRCFSGKYRITSYSSDLLLGVDYFKNCIENDENFINILTHSVERRTPLHFYIKPNPFDHNFYKVCLLPIVHTVTTKIFVNVESCSNSHQKNFITNKKSKFNICLIAQTETGTRIIKEVSNGFLHLTRKNTISYEDILFNHAVDECFENSIPSSCFISLKSEKDKSMGFKIYCVPLCSEFNSQYSLVSIIPFCNSEPQENSDPTKNITHREQEIVGLAANGCTNRYIAHKLLITEGTVKKTLHNAYKKLGINSRVELVKMYRT